MKNPKYISILMAMAPGKLLLLSCFLATCIFCHAQGNQHATQTIREEFRAINADSTLKSVELDIEDFLGGSTDGGGSLTGYYKNNKLVKIEEWIGLSFGNKIREFYLKDGHLFFVYDRLESFIQKDGALDNTKPNRSFEARYYIVEDKIISKKISGEKPFGEKSSSDLKEINAVVTSYKKQLASKK